MERLIGEIFTRLTRFHEKVKESIKNAQRSPGQYRLLSMVTAFPEESNGELHATPSFGVHMPDAEH